MVKKKCARRCCTGAEKERWGVESLVGMEADFASSRTVVDAVGTDRSDDFDDADRDSLGTPVERVESCHDGDPRPFGVVDGFGHEGHETQDDDQRVDCGTEHGVLQAGGKGTNIGQ